MLNYILDIFQVLTPDPHVSIVVANYRTEPSSPVTPAIHTSTYSAGTLPEKSHIWQKL